MKVQADVPGNTYILLTLGTRLLTLNRLRCKKFCFYCIEDFSGSLEGARWTHLLPPAPKVVQASFLSHHEVWLLNGGSASLQSWRDCEGGLRDAGVGRCEGRGAEEVNSCLGQKFREGLATPPQNLLSLVLEPGGRTGACTVSNKVKVQGGDIPPQAITRGP